MYKVEFMTQKDDKIIAFMLQKKGVGKQFKAEKMIVEEMTEAVAPIRAALKGLSIGQWIKLLRKQLGMSRRALSMRAKIPQSTLFRVEQGTGEANIRTIAKILNAVSCDLFLVPVLNESIDIQRRKQARKKAENHIRIVRPSD